MRERPFVVGTGCGRSGTTFMARVFRECGLDVQGEDGGGKDGMVSWYLGAGEKCVRPPYGPEFSRLPKPRFVLHIVRDPIRCISSMQTANDWSRGYIARVTGIRHRSEAQFFAEYWVVWNRMIEAFADHRFRIEDLEREWPLISERTGADMEKGLHIARTTDGLVNTRRGQYQLLSLDEIREAVDRETFLRLIETATRYGYEL